MLRLLLCLPWSWSQPMTPALSHGPGPGPWSWSRRSLMVLALSHGSSALPWPKYCTGLGALGPSTGLGPWAQVLYCPWALGPSTVLTCQLKGPSAVNRSPHGPRAQPQGQKLDGVSIPGVKKSNGATAESFRVNWYIYSFLRNLLFAQ